ncbi:MAG: hypothetical protein HQL58_00180 [Magnetococcales bacterium]|nr:hypothetical protein [Magnetococcales bacterium]
MKLMAVLLLLVGSVVASSVAQADATDAAWVQKCVRDNAREGQSAGTVAIYCTCMNNKMSDNETQSITAWEKSHPAEMAACEREAGWK